MEKDVDVGDEGGWGIDEQGQASPNGTSLIAVRELGQIGVKPVMRSSQRTGTRTIGVEDAWVVGCDRR